MLKRIVYVSTATDLLETAVLDGILARSRDNNQRDGITGLLLYDGGNFLQTIEGEPKPIDALMARIGGDPRHYGLRMMEEDMATRRMFSDWSMGYGRLDRTDMAEMVDRLAPEPQAETTLAAVMLNVFLRNMDNRL